MRGEDSAGGAQGGETEKLEELQHREKTTRMFTLSDILPLVNWRQVERLRLLLQRG